MNTTDLLLCLLAIEPQSRHGAMVSIAAVRSRLGNPPTFDADMLWAWDSGQVALHRHDYPQGESVEARNAMVVDNGNYYNGITMRG